MRDVEVRGLSKSFGGRVLFRRLNLTFRAGEITVLAGENGVGKTTLLRMMLGLERPDSGEISGLPDARSALFQEDRLLPDLSAARNVALGCRRPPPREDVLRALDAVGLRESADVPARELSGGMARRAALVRALMAPGELVLLDEPFSGLDWVNLHRVAAFIRAAHAGRTLIAVVHGVDAEAALGGRLLRLEPSGAAEGTG